MSKSKAIPFIIRDQQTSKYQLTGEAQQFLSTITTNISIISVAGLYRTGKSYLLNRVILNQSGGFGVGGTVNACTKGLWMWAEVIHTVDNHNLLVVDTQGLGALDQQVNHDMKIFCLAVLLSTTFIYNSLGSIDETALQNLNIVLNLVNTIDNNGNTRPNFIWVVRDFSLQLIDDTGKSITSKQYLQIALSGTKDPEKIAVRKTITTAFAERDCFTLVKPVIDEQKLQKLEQIPIDELRGEFVSQTMCLRKKIMSSLKNIRLNNNQQLKGKDYLLMAKKYVIAINQGVIPNISDTWSFIKEEKGRRVAYELQKQYTEKIKHKMNSKLPITQQQLQQYMLNYQNQMIEQFHRSTYEDTSTQQIEKFIKATHQQLQKINHQQNKIIVQGVLQKQYEPIQKKLSSDYYPNYEQFTHDINNMFKKSLIEKYASKFDEFTSILQQFCEKKLIEGYKTFDRKTKQQLKLLNQMKETKQKNWQQEIQITRQRTQKQINHMQQQIEGMQSKIIYLSNEKMCLQQEIIKEKAQGQLTIQKNHKKMEEQLSNIENLKAELMLKNNKSQEIEKISFMHKKQIEKQKALSLQKEEHLTNKFQQLQKKYQQLKSQLQKNGGKFDSERKQMMGSFDQKIRQLLQENKLKSQKLCELEGTVDNYQDQNTKLKDQIKQLKEYYQHQTQQAKAKVLRDQSNKKEDPELSRARRQNQDYMSKLEQLKQKNQQLVNKCKQIEDELKLCKSSCEKEIVIHKQQIQFQEIQINQLKGNYNELQKRYQNALENMQVDSKEHEKKLQQQIFDLMEEHQKNIKMQEQDYQRKITQFKKEAQRITQENQATQLQIALENKKYQTKQRETKQAYSSLENLYHNLSKKLASSQRDYQDSSQQKDNYFLDRVKKLEQQIQNVKEKANQQMQESIQKSEKALNVLKNYSEMERQQWQQRMIDQKEKSSKQLRQLKDELQRRHQQQKCILQQQVNETQQKMEQMQRIFKQKIQNMQYDNDIKFQKISNQYMQNKVEMQKKTALLTQQIQLTRKNMQQQLNEMKRYYEHTIEQNKKQMNLEFEQTKIKMAEEKRNMSETIDTLKKNNNQAEKTIMVLKNQNDKEKSIFKEKEKHYNKQLSELQTRLSSQLLSYTKTVQSIHESNEEERMRLNEEIDKLKKNIVTSQEERNKMQADFQSQRSSLIAKNSYLQLRVTRCRQDYEDTLKKFEISVKHLSQRNKLGGFKELQQMRERLKLQFERRIHEKQQIFQRQCKDSDDKVARLQTQNKSLKDRLLLLQVRNSSITSKDTKVAEEVKKVKDKYKDNLDEMNRTLQVLQAENKALKQREGINSIFNQSERNSILTDTMNENGRRMSNLTDQKGARKYGSNAGNTPLISKKTQKNGRVINLNDFTGIIKYQ